MGENGWTRHTLPLVLVQNQSGEGEGWGLGREWMEEKDFRM